MNYLYCDFETTGLDPKKHAPYEIGAIAVINGEEKESFVRTMKPFKGAVIDPGALTFMEDKSLHKTEIELYQYQDDVDVLKEFTEYCDSFGTTFQFRAYNADFDKGFLNAWFNRNMCNADLIRLFYPGSHCVLKDAREKIKIRGHKLENVCKHLGIVLKDAHTAYADIKATIEVDRYLRSLEKIPSLLHDKMEYREKKLKFSGPDYFTVGSDGSIHITNKCTRDAKVFTFVLEEIYNQFGV